MPDTNVIMPQMGESIFEGTITKWLHQEGDTIRRDEPLFEISTDKIDSEIPAPQSGTLRKILVGEGETVEINTVVAIIAASGAVGEAEAEAMAAPPAPSAPRPTTGSRSAGAGAADGDAKVASSPMVRRLAAENDIDLSDLKDKGTGAGGRITKRDILSHIEQHGKTAGSAQAPAGDAVERVPMTAMRRTIAEHMVASRRTSAHVATIFEVDCSAVMKARRALAPDFEQAGIHLTVSPFFVQAAARALRKFPILNASVEGDEIVLRKAIHVGVAVAVEDGLIVPVVRDADRRELRDLARSIADLAERARTKKLRPEEVGGGTFTVTNPGNFGGLYGIPIINQPQVAILAMGGIEKRPVVVDDAIAIRPMVYLALSFDHRIIDGAVADQFMSAVKRTLETQAV